MSSGSKAFDVGRMAMGGLGQMLDSVEFVKRAWSTLNIPSQLVPTVDVEELDKRIADLKAVEQWLNANLGMLRGTIQALEIQRGTLAAVKAFGSTLGNVRVPGLDGASAAAPSPFERIAREAAQAAPPPMPVPEVAPPMPVAPEPEPEPEPAPRRAGRKGAASAKAAAAAMPGLPGISPGAWWNMLQQNFNQVAEAALSGVGLQGAVAAGQGAAREPVAAPAAKGRAKARAGSTRAAPKTGGGRRPGTPAPRRRRSSP
ncbi:MAG TPA: PhaM family polyhydroxyalkanoate granule multifunctional regulatory protein, partial [Burkholderiaceae bacterium]|nr:PhaM family polyhydroxyalkanoate granule multifunctional regulatory protein [Burkholderiaceae bacterium]